MFCPHSVFMCFVWISEQTAIISLYNINCLVCITETDCVYCAVRTGSLYVIQVGLSHRRLVSGECRFLWPKPEERTSRSVERSHSIFCACREPLRAHRKLMTAPSLQKRLILLSARRLLVRLLVTSRPGPIKVTKHLSISEIILEFECGVDRTGKVNVVTKRHLLWRGRRRGSTAFVLTFGMNVSVPSLLVCKVWSLVPAGSDLMLHRTVQYLSNLTGSLFYLASVFCHFLPLLCCERPVGRVSYDTAINEPKGSVSR